MSKLPPVTDGQKEVPAPDPHEREIPAALRFSGVEPTPATATVIERPSGWRTTAVLKELALWWGLALISLFIPLWHFIGVPVFLLVGAWRAWGRLREKRTLIDLRGTCPKCGAEQEWTEHASVGDRHEVECGACHWTLDAELGTPAVPPAEA
ncbi:hypothetical protein BH23GEM4_BH23GEM4_23120 [soil metagenome]